MWNTCQAHSSTNHAEENFVPWHRMYVLYLEEIIRAVSGASDFTLPSWSYNNPDNRMIPAQFRMPGEPVFGPLYRQNRNVGVNAGKPIDKLSGAIPMNIEALKQADYLPGSIESGFNQTLYFGLHGAVHVNIGTSSNMGYVPTAAGDPIFWLHHAQIDRLWASWNANGGANPPASWDNWGDRSWTFVDGNGMKVIARIADMIKGTEPLGYKFQSLIPAPPKARMMASAQATLLAAVAPSPAAALTTTHGGAALKLGDGPATIELARTASISAFHNMVSTLTAAAPASTGRKQIYLAVDRLTTDEQPRTGYNVYLELPKNASPQVAAGHYVGSINFFHAHPAAKTHDAHALGYVFDVTELAASLAVKDRLSRTPALTVVPTGSSVKGSEPAIGSFRLIEG
jgi:tyrosinase